jgi:hypothetical protein
MALDFFAVSRPVAPGTEGHPQYARPLARHLVRGCLDLSAFADTPRSSRSQAGAGGPGRTCNDSAPLRKLTQHTA